MVLELDGFSYCLHFGRVVVTSRGHYFGSLSRWSFDWVQGLRWGQAPSTAHRWPDGASRRSNTNGPIWTVARPMSNNASLVIEAIVESARRTSTNSWGWRVLTGEILSLTYVVSFHPKTGIVIPVTGREKMVVLLEIAEP